MTDALLRIEGLTAGYDRAAVIRDVGLTELSVTVHQPAFTTGERKRLWEYTFLEAGAGAAAAGVGTEEEVAEMVAEFAAISGDDSALVVQPALLHHCDRGRHDRPLVGARRVRHGPRIW